jgi:hypothetical protein
MATSGTVAEQKLTNFDNSQVDSSRDKRNIIDVNSRRENRISRDASNSRDANN